MGNHPFDVDDILSEINKRKEESETDIPSAPENVEAVQSEAAEAEVVASNEEPVQEHDEPQISEAPAEAEKETVNTQTVGAHFSRHEESESYFEEVDKIFSDSQSSSANTEENAINAGGVNILDFAEDRPMNNSVAPVRNSKKSKSKKKWNKTRKGKILISVILILVLAIVGTGAFGFFYVNDILDNITVDEGERNENSKVEEWNGMDNLVVKFDDINEDSYASSYRDMAKKWYYNGEPASSTNILNVLLIGEDTRGDEIKDEGSRADSVMIASVNTETKELVLTSILRDTYSYYELVPGDESTGRYGKINEAMSRGDLTTYINAVERLFKINIDNYVLVNFSNFKKIIDTLGGVDIEMTAKEIKEINNHKDRYGNVYIDGEAGMKHLNGEQALAYSRIRYIDSDNARADRQKTVLLNVFSQLKNASMLKLTSVVTNLLPYVKTGFTKSEILSLGEYALSHGWLGYNIVKHTVPQNGTRADGSPYTVCVGGKGSNFFNTWCWKVDFPLAAQVLQEKIYGKTNIILANNRPSFKNLSAY
ncbi:MAG: LCP family protein [Eubacterium sp.]|nr:LCP family protein [Eubacterium sp.]